MDSSLKNLQRPENDSDGADQAYDQSIIIPSKIISVGDSLRKKEHSWFITSQMPTDLSVQVQDTVFNVHKYPLVSKCGYFGRLELQPSNSNTGYDFKLEQLPGGSETFEMILKFCYGLPIDLNPTNLAPLRCASEYLEMTEELEDGNLISKSEAFLTFVILSSRQGTITVLKSCESLSPWAENLQIVRRCCDSVARKAPRENSITGDAVNEDGWWLDDVVALRIDHFMRIITAVRATGTKPEFIGKCIMHYAKMWLPGMQTETEGMRGYGQGKNDLEFRILSGRREEVGIGYNKEKKGIIESLLSIFPPQPEALPCKFLLLMLKLAMAYSASPALISELEERIGMMLEDANVNDLLIPVYEYNHEGKLQSSLEERTVHDIEAVKRIVEYFLMHEKQQQEQYQKPGKSNVSKLIDSYLAEIARDSNLSITNFQLLAELLPENARMCHDGLYSAIDTYLKAHPSLSEHDRRRLCKIIDSDKLSLDACTHAAQNDRLPLRTIIQVLFSEQLKMRMAMQGKEQAQNGDNSELEGNNPSTDTEIKALKAELESVKMEMAELQRDYSELQREYEKISNKQKNVSAWSLGWRKIKNSFHLRVDGEETGEVQQRPSPLGCRVGLRRRLSLP